MKIKGLLLGLAGLFLLVGCGPNQVVHGDKNIITEVIDISDYDEIKLVGASMVVNYKQTEDAPFLEVTTDQNIYDMYEFIIEDTDALIIRPKKEYRRKFNIRPSEFTVTTNSRGLEDIDIAGNVTFNINEAFNSDKLELELAGSGSVHLNDTANIKSVDVKIAGSGSLYASALFSTKFKSEVAGSGFLQMAGRGEQATFKIAGSGDFRGYDFILNDMSCSIAGSGEIQTHVNGNMTVEVAGSGNIKYKGEPTNIIRKIIGSGSVQKVD